MKKLLLSAVLCGVVALSFSACSSEPEKLVDLAKKMKEIKQISGECDEQEGYTYEEMMKCKKENWEELKKLKLEGDEIWKTLSEEEKDLTKELMEKEELENRFD